MVIKQVYLYSRENLIKLRMYIKDPYVTRYMTQEKIRQISFVGTIGGSLGLFLGFSFISVVEIFTLLTLVLKKLMSVWMKDY